MNSRHLVDPELLPALDALPSLHISREMLGMVRGQLASLYERMSAGASASQTVQMREVFADGPAGAASIRLLVYSANRSGLARPAYLYLHGGGFYMGSPDMADAQSRTLAETLDCVVVAVDYRLAPETSYPGNIEDCYAALSWMYRNADELGIDSSRIAVGGESAGGGLAAALALLARDRGEYSLIHQQLIYPMLDDRSPAEPHPYTGEFGWTSERNRFAWHCLLGHEPGGEGVSPYAAAARADRLNGLPPTFIGVGALDLLVEENLDYARRLMRAGVAVELHIYPGAFHGSDVAAKARVSRMHSRDQLAALRTAFARSSSREHMKVDVLSAAEPKQLSLSKRA